MLCPFINKAKNEICKILGARWTAWTPELRVYTLIFKKILNLLFDIETGQIGDFACREHEYSNKNHTMQIKNCKFVPLA